MKENNDKPEKDKEIFWLKFENTLFRVLIFLIVVMISMLYGIYTGQEYVESKLVSVSAGSRDNVYRIKNIEYLVTVEKLQSCPKTTK